VAANPDQINCAPSGARTGILCFSLDFDLHRCGLLVSYIEVNTFWFGTGKSSKVH
jgi:hypothetical protein